MSEPVTQTSYKKTCPGGSNPASFRVFSPISGRIRPAYRVGGLNAFANVGFQSIYIFRLDVPAVAPSSRLGSAPPTYFLKKKRIVGTRIRTPTPKVRATYPKNLRPPLQSKSVQIQNAFGQYSLPIAQSAECIQVRLLWQCLGIYMSRNEKHIHRYTFS